MKKKIFAVLIAAILIGGLCGCSIQTAATAGSEPASQQTAEEQQTASPELTEIAAPAEVAVRYHWDLAPVFADAGAFGQELQKVEKELIPTLSEFEGKLNTQENILAFIKQKDIVDQKFRKLNVYATLLTEQNQGDNAATALMQQENKAHENYSKAIAFFNPELLANSDEFLDELLKNPEMQPFVNEIERLRKNAEHVLPEETEVLLQEP